MKRNAIITLASILSVCAVAGTGFASWVITGNVEANPLDGSFTVETVTDNHHEMTADFKAGQGVIHYGKPADQTVINGVTDPWFTFDAETKDEVLTAAFTVTVTNYTAAPVDIVTGTVAAYKGDSLQEGFFDEDKSYVPAPVVKIDTYAPVENETNKWTANGTVTFKWGTTVGGQEQLNPYVYWNGQVGTSANKTLAANAINGLVNKLKGITYKLTLKFVNNN